jgi:large repetitive protein
MGLPAGRFTLTASKPGLLTLAHGQRRAGEAGRPIEVPAGAIVEGVDFSLPRGAAIEGQVFDEAGDPVAGVSVTALRQRYVNGQRQLRPGGGAVSTTDDLGRFRVYGLAPGSYYLSAVVAAMPGRTAGAADGSPTYYPGTPTSAEAQPQAVSLGQDVSGIAFQLVSAKTATIAGVVRAADGQPFMRTMVRLDPRDASGIAGRTSPAAPDGSFSFTHLSPGEYVLSAQTLNPAGGPGVAGWAGASVTLTGADVTIVLTPTPARTARGRILFERGDPSTLRPGDAQIGFSPEDPAGPMIGLNAVVGADWMFEAPSQFGRRRFRATLPAGWYVKAVRRGGIDVTDAALDFDTGDIEGLEVVLTQQATEISGRVASAPRAEAIDATVVIFAEDRQHWRFPSRHVRTTRPDQNGRYAVRGLPRGRYRAVALDYLEQGEETSHEYLETLVRHGTPFVLEEGESRQLDLDVTEAP